MGTTPVTGLPYPESTDLVRDGATAMQALATAAETRLGVAVAGARMAGATQSIPNSAATTPSLSTPLSYSGGVSGTGGGLSCPVDGWYLAGFQWMWDANGTGYRYIEIYDNATGVSYAKQTIAAAGASDAAQNISAILPLAAGTVLRVRVFQNSGGALSSRNSTLRIQSLALLGYLASTPPPISQV